MSTLPGPEEESEVRARPAASTKLGWCSAGNHDTCRAILPPISWPDPARKGSRYTKPERVCSCPCHLRDMLKPQSRK